jgi:subtilisin family serine protease
MMRVLIQLRSSQTAHAAARASQPAPALTAHVASAVPGLQIDADYPPVQVPGVISMTGGPVFSLDQPVTYSHEAGDSTYLVRGQLPDGGPGLAALRAARAHPEVVGVFADPVIESCPVCGGDGPVGSDVDVAKLLHANDLAGRGMDGRGVYLAVVDTGINAAYLKTRGRQPDVRVTDSWTPKGVASTPGQHPVDHGTMCAFDATITAPKAQLLDYAVLLSRRHGSTAMEGLLSDAVLAYSKLRQVLNGMPQDTRAMVITNSWGMFTPTWDFPPGHPGNYSDNPTHPFNVIVGSLDAAGADILFAAGNCGRDCPDGRCNFGGTLPICGANSHPSVISVAGVDINKARVGYSSQGPGRLDRNKPNIAAYTHFQGSGVYPADSGTSAACPVAAGVVAAVRSKHSATALSPHKLRSLLYKSADDEGRRGFDWDYGWGVIDPGHLLKSLT